MRKAAIVAYKRLFVRRRFYRFHRLLFTLATRGLGILNFEDETVSGEAYFTHLVTKRWPALTVVDVGANVGSYASRIKTLAPAATIHAFEPHPETYQRLQAVAQVLGFIAVNLGCGEQSGSVTLYDHNGTASGTSHATLYRGVLEQAGHSPPTAVEVQMTTLDAYAHRAGLDHIHLLKIDTEGHELAVLRGARQLIEQRRIGAIQFEFNAMNVASRSFFQDFRQVLPRYRFYRLLPDGLITLEPYRALDCELFAYQNIAAIQDDSELLRALKN